MQRHIVGASLGLVALCALGGCEPQPAAQELKVRVAGGEWNDCLEAIDSGVAGDGCDFDPEEIGTAMTCETTHPPHLVGTEVIGGHAVPVVRSDIDVLAHCRSGSLILHRPFREEGAGPAVPAVEEDGCLLHSPVFSAEREWLCVGDDLLAETSTGDEVDIDASGACERIVDGIVRAGDACIGDTICASVGAEHVYSRPELERPVGRPGVYAWCGAGRIRIASALLELPCDHFDDNRQTFVCAL